VSRATRWTVAALLPLLVAVTGSAQEATGSVVVLSVSYADGRVASHIVSTRGGGSWTPYFPKVAEWRSDDGLAVSAVNLRYALEEKGVRVRISLFLGTPQQKEIDVATVLVARHELVVVEALSSYGVNPVKLSVTDVEAPTLYPPQVENKTAALHVESVEIVDAPRPGYRVTVRNYSSKPVLSFAVETANGAQRALSGRQGARDGTSVAAGDTHTFTINSDRPYDSIRITGLMFEDGSIEGDASGVATTRLVHFGRRIQLSRVLELLKGSGQRFAGPADAIASLSSQVERLSVLPDAASLRAARHLFPSDRNVSSAEMTRGAISTGMLDVRQGVVGDLKSAPRDRDAFAAWLTEITAQYQKWYLRFVTLTTD
jgi:hypothetical protein